MCSCNYSAKNQKDCGIVEQSCGTVGENVSDDKAQECDCDWEKGKM